MQSLAHRWRRIAALLAFTLALSGALAAAHQHADGVRPSDDSCAVCVVAGHASALPAEADAPFVWLASDAPPAIPVARPGWRALVAAAGRGPPLLAEATLS